VTPPLELLPRAVGAPGGLADALLRGDGPVVFPNVAGAGSRLGTPGRLEATAFGTTSPALRERLERVLRGEGLVVTTGQQPVLFLGPLYVVYKALTAIRLAEWLERRLEVPVVPVFWIASDDHDWHEIGQCTVLSPDGELETVRLDPPDGFEGRSAGPAPLGPEISTLCYTIEQLLPESDFTPDYLQLFRDTYAPGHTVSEAFAGALSGLLRGEEFAWLDASGQALKTAAAGFFERLLEAAGPTIEAAAAGADALTAAGYEPPIATIPDALPLFYDGGDGRHRIVRTEAGFAAGADGPAAPAGEWSDRLRASPERFSPNVSSRPVLESWLLPVAATVLGPGEIAYWAQLAPLFELLEVPFPAVQRRAAWLVVEPRTRRTLERYGLQPEELADGGDAAVERLTADSRPPAVGRALGGLRGAIGSALGPLDEAVAAEVPGLRGAVGKSRKALFDAVAELEKAVDQEARRAHETDVARIRRTAGQLFPGRGSQERTLSPLYFLSRYGDAFLEAAKEGTAEWLEDLLAGGSGER